MSDTWLALEAPLPRRLFIQRGVILALVKYAGDMALVSAAGGTWFAPWEYFSPIGHAFGAAERLTPPFHTTAEWLAPVLALWALPFLYVGVTYSLRRALDAGRNGWWSLLFFVPWLNWLLIAVLAVLPSRPDASPASREAPTEAGRSASRSKLSSGLLSIAQGLAVGLVGVLGLVFGLDRYGASLFLGLPVTVGAVTAFSYARHTGGSLRETLEVVTFALLALAGSYVAFAIEGLVCLLLAMPMALPLAYLGATLGRRLADTRAAAPVRSALLLVPVWAVVESSAPTTTPLREVRSVVHIDAPPAVVWEHVVAFPPLPPPTDLASRLGIAAPLRARIVGAGGGAVRYCEFPTGPFIEPITAWEPARRLAFDVVAQPKALRELSPYAAVHPPHVDGWITSERGEFRLVPLPHGGTRLEGRTWYRMGLAPSWYWGAVGDWFIHRVHLRVLVHVRRVSEGALARAS